MTFNEGTLVYVVGLEVIATGLIGWSPMYTLFAFSTTEKVGA
jgi:hypothetical protein